MSQLSRRLFLVPIAVFALLAGSRLVQMTSLVAESASPSEYASYVRITDDSESMTLRVPPEWKDIETGVWILQGKRVGTFLAASRDLTAFYAGQAVPGVFLGASHDLMGTLGVAGVLNLERQAVATSCVPQGRADFSDPYHRGQLDRYSQCRGGQEVLVLAGPSANGENLVLLRLSSVSQADRQAATRILETFSVLGTPGEDGHHDH